MHLISSNEILIEEDSYAVEIQQSPGDIAVLSFAITELNLLAVAKQRWNTGPSLRLANLNKLRHNLSVDLYIDAIISKSKLVIVRLIGGKSYWSYGIDEIRRQNIKYAFLPGSGDFDHEMFSLSNIDKEEYWMILRYFQDGGIDNAINLLKYSSNIIGHYNKYDLPKEMDGHGIYSSLGDIKGSIPIIFYRALYQSGDIAPIDKLAATISRRGFKPLPVYVNSLKDKISQSFINDLLIKVSPPLVIDATYFVNGYELPVDCPIIQVMQSSTSQKAWENSSQGISSRDLAMQIALPEIDGKIISRVMSFREKMERDDNTEIDLELNTPNDDRIEHIVDLATSWIELRQTPRDKRRIMLIIANYPNRDGRIGNGVGLDTPESAAIIMQEMASNGYCIKNIPANGQEIINKILDGTTNSLHRTESDITLDMDTYKNYFANLTQEIREKINSRWGAPETDPFVKNNKFHLAIHEYGRICIGIQPARGYNIDPKSSYHDPALPPPHNYLAFYFWIRHVFRVHAIVNIGKHGNLEWLPGKANALSSACFPDQIIGPTPTIYPFIVNDPGEGTQAKRRTSAVIIDHLTPAMTKAENYGDLLRLEQLLEEYQSALTLDKRRLEPLEKDIISLAQAINIDKDCGITLHDPTNIAIGKLDNYLCEVKEWQIRDGLHIFGRSPNPEQVRELAEIIYNSANNQNIDEIIYNINQSSHNEITNLLKALDGKFILPGPSGAPSRGRPEVLPTGRNFYSLDVRAVPTPASWHLGFKSAALLIERYVQENGEYPKTIGITAWGTSNMRTGGDDIAQAMALIGAQPIWEPTTGRVTGFQVLNPSQLDRPRIDVTLRISGFFRDAFPQLIELFDQAVRHIAELDEPEEVNPIAAQFKKDLNKFPAQEARLLAGSRVFGSQPGAYGAGLQAMIDERLWENRADLGNAYITWGSFIYGSNQNGANNHQLFKHRLINTQLVIQNQDNREHDILDSDDYYQFQGGMAAAIESLSQKAPTIYHADHSRPQNPKIRTLSEEISRVIRARATNPKWIKGVMRHGYKGAFEMAATLDYMFSFAATTNSVRGDHFDALFNAYLGDETVRSFIAENNPPALKEMAARFKEAIERQMWQTKLNHAITIIDDILS